MGRTPPPRLGMVTTASLLILLLQACSEGRPDIERHASVAPTTALARSLQAGALPEPTDIPEWLHAIAGLTVVQEIPPLFPGTRVFLLEYDQPVDHRHPEGRRFRQRLSLLHRSPEAPMVLSLSGYGITPRGGQSEPTRYLQANQLLVEHRFFGPSTPQPMTWEHLNIEQAAADHHRIVQAFKPFYPGRWISTGISKGGMTAVYHRYFHSDDVDATLAYVAPNSHGDDDPRYSLFLDNVGDEDCRQRVLELQREVLLRRERLMPFMDRLTEETGATFHLLGKDRAFEFAAVEMPFYYWQYYAWFCPYLPKRPLTDEELWGYLQLCSMVEYTYADDVLTRLAPYYYQSATQTGAPRYPEAHLRGLLRYPREDIPSNYPPFGVEKRFDVTAMLRVKHWVRDHGQRMMFIYGERDPWSAGAFEVSESNDSIRFFLPGGDHYSFIGWLPEPLRSQALERLYTWAGVTPQEASRLAAAAENGEGDDWESLPWEQRLRR